MAFAAGRMGLTEFRALIGIGKTTFYTRLRSDPGFINRVDLRTDASGRLHMSEREANRFAREWLGSIAANPSERAETLLRRCPHCDELVRLRASVCKHCGRDIVPGDDQADA